MRAPRLDETQTLSLIYLLKAKIFDYSLLPQGYYLRSFKKTLISVQLELTTNGIFAPQLKVETGSAALEAFNRMVQSWGALQEMSFEIWEMGTSRGNGSVKLVSPSASKGLEIR